MNVNVKTSVIDTMHIVTFGSNYQRSIVFFPLSETHEFVNKNPHEEILNSCVSYHWVVLPLPRKLNRNREPYILRWTVYQLYFFHPICALCGQRFLKIVTNIFLELQTVQTKTLEGMVRSRLMMNDKSNKLFTKHAQACTHSRVNMETGSKMCGHRQSSIHTTWIHVKPSSL